ncbi:MAG: YdcF family protein [Clostridia bacterium]|nr:YdcF family protein [Clostridia bacterium]
MKKTVKILSIIAGSLLLGNTALMSVIANFNIGLLPVAALGVLLLLYGIFFDRLPCKRLVHCFVGTVLAVLIIFGSFLAAYGRNDNADYNEKTVIVLGCGIRGERVSVGLAKRLDKAAEYHKENPKAMIIVSGGQGPQEDISEALAMKRYLVAKGIDEDKIIMEDKSTSTITNFRYSREIMEKEGMSLSSVVFVTNGYHVYRAASYAKAEGFLEVSHLGTDIIWYTIPMNYMREMLAVVKMWVFDR